MEQISTYYNREMILYHAITVKKPHKILSQVCYESVMSQFCDCYESIISLLCVYYESIMNLFWVYYEPVLS